jgi:metal-responsive CopG/Arc/MetJ family transcriptional regulator
MWYVLHMAAKPVQITLDGDLLRRIDRDPEVKKLGRSAFIRNAVSAYLQAKERRDIDAAIRNAYEGKADDVVDEVDDIMRAQAWPES